MSIPPYIIWWFNRSAAQETERVVPFAYRKIFINKRRRSSILSDSHVFAVDADRTGFRFSSPEPALHGNYSMTGRRVATDSS